MPKLIVLILLCLTIGAVPAEQTDPFWHFYDLLPGSGTWAGYFETFQPESTVLIENSNGFASMDRARIYFDGWSPRALPWMLNDLAFNSRLFSGSPQGFLPHAALSGFIGDSSGFFGSGPGIHMIPYMAGFHSSVSMSTVSPNLGSYSPWAAFLISTPAVERPQLLYETRRQFDGQFHLDGQWSRRWGDGHQLALAFTHQMAGRMFNDFGERDHQFVENANGTDIYGDYQYNTTERSTRIWLLINRLDRDHEGAELGMLPEETLSLNRTNWSAGVGLRRWGWQLSAMLGYERDQTDPSQLNYAKEIMDNDGDMIFSQSPFGTRSSLNFSGRFEREAGEKQILLPFLAWNIQSYQADEDIHDHNTLTLDGQPCAVILWDQGHSVKQQNQLYHAATGLQLNLPVSDTVLLTGRAEFNLDGFAGRTLVDKASFLRPGLFGALIWRWNQRSELMFGASRYAHPMTGELIDFLDTSRPGGNWFRWGDTNENGEYEAGENGAYMRPTGGSSHLLDESFKLPMVTQIQFSLKFPLSTHWRFETHGSAKEIRDAWTVRHAHASGSWKTIDGKSMYILDQPPANYILTNLETSRQKPQYWHLMFRFMGEKPDKWYFSFSFMAHMGLGETPLGNGPGSNDYLALSETSADPNSWANNYGRLDGDRAFVAKLSYALNLSKRLSIGLTAKYRDGNPFAFLSAQMVENQLVLIHETLKGEDQKGNKLGPREDYLSEINLRVNYRLPLLGGTGQLSLEWHNLIDVGYELSEYVYNQYARLPLELNIPRSIRLTLSWMDRP